MSEEDYVLVLDGRICDVGTDGTIITRGSKEKIERLADSLMEDYPWTWHVVPLQEALRKYPITIDNAALSRLSAEHGGDPDEIERKVIDAVHRLTEQAWNRTDCTRQLNVALGEIAKSLGFQRYAQYLKITRSDPDQAGGWLWDMTWLDGENGEIVLALESEWDESTDPKVHNENIDHDFTKLLSVKARHRAFIFCDADVEGQLDRLIEQVDNFPQTQGGDRFLLIGLDCQTKRRIREKVIVAPGPSYAELRKAHDARILAGENE